MNTGVFSEGIIITAIIFIIIIFVILFWLAYAYWGTPASTYVIVFLILFFLILAAVAIYFFAFSQSNLFVPITPPTPVNPGPTPTPPVSMPVNFGDTISLDNVTSSVGTTPCNNNSSGGFPVTTTAAQRNKIWRIQALLASPGGNLTYGSTFTLVNTSMAFPQTAITFIQSSTGLYQLFVPTAGSPVIFTINRAPGTSGSSNVVMYGEIGRA